VPLAFPIILYKFVGTFGGLYNDYLWPSLILTNKFTVTLALYQARNSLSAGIDPMKGAIYAMYIISIIPLIFTSIISMKYFSGGDFAAGIKL
jgi:ABC-type glycerol-3-phosphate transport system permease component